MLKNKSTRLSEEEEYGGDELLKETVVNIRMKSLTLDERTEAMNPSMPKSKVGQLLSAHDMPGAAAEMGGAVTEPKPAVSSSSSLSVGTNENDHEVGNRQLFGDDEVVSQVDVLPEEVWKLIFEFFNNQDMLTDSRSYTKWGDWLAGKGTLFLFHKVLPLIRNELTLADLLRLRLVCRSWKNDLDDASFFPTPTDALVFKTFAETDRFLQQMASHPGNPFPQRCIRFKREIERNPFPLDDGLYGLGAHVFYWIGVIALLERFGHHAWTVYIFIDGEQPDRLQECLTRLPQLKRLAVDCGGFTGQQPPRLLLNRVQDNHSANPFLLPQLLHLEELRTGSKVPDYMVDAVLESCDRDVVKILDLEAGSHDGIYRFPNLEVLNANVHVVGLRMFWHVNLSPPLKRIKLKVHSTSFGIQWNTDLKNLFSILEQFAETLTHIHVQGFPELTAMGAVGAYKISPPKLKSLKLWEYNGPLDPFIELRSLTHLEISNVKVITNPCFERISVVKYWGLKESKIWTLLPSLNWLKVKVATQNGKIKFSGHRPDRFHPPRFLLNV